MTLAVLDPEACDSRGPERQMAGEAIADEVMANTSESPHVICETAAEAVSEIHHEAMPPWLRTTVDPSPSLPGRPVAESLRDEERVVDRRGPF